MTLSGRWFRSEVHFRLRVSLLSDLPEEPCDPPLLPRPPSEALGLGQRVSQPERALRSRRHPASRPARKSNAAKMRAARQRQGGSCRTIDGRWAGQAEGPSSGAIVSPVPDWTGG